MKGLERAIELAGNKAKLAETLGEAPSLLTRWFRGDRSPTLNKVTPILDFLGAKVLFPDQPYTLPTSEYVFVSKALAKPAAGGGSLETSGETEGGLVFKLSWLKERTHTSPEHLRIMKVRGSSMSPTFENDDVVLVDEGNTELNPDRVYVIRKGEEIYVKRYRKTPDALLFIGDNRARDFEDVRVAQGEEDGFAVIGRVLWAGKEL
jgi:transcriptional regulator with XRE-family HTH domain